jgi:hypothetical protein
MFGLIKVTGLRTPLECNRFTSHKSLGVKSFQPTKIGSSVKVW